MDYKDLLDEILKSDEELKEAYQLKNEVTYFYEHATVGNGFRKAEHTDPMVFKCKISEFSNICQNIDEMEKEIINSFIVLKQEYYIDAATVKRRCKRKR